MAQYGTLRGYKLGEADADEIRGADVYGNNDEKLGTVDDAIFDHGTGTLKYLVVNTGGSKQFLVPADRVEPRGDKEDEFQVGLSKRDIEKFPPYNPEDVGDDRRFTEYQQHYTKAYEMLSYDGGVMHREGSTHLLTPEPQELPPTGDLPKGYHSEPIQKIGTELPEIGFGEQRGGTNVTMSPVTSDFDFRRSGDSATGVLRETLPVDRSAEELDEEAGQGRSLDRPLEGEYAPGQDRRTIATQTTDVVTTQASGLNNVSDVTTPPVNDNLASPSVGEREVLTIRDPQTGGRVDRTGQIDDANAHDQLRQMDLSPTDVGAPGRTMEGDTRFNSEDVRHLTREGIGTNLQAQNQAVRQDLDRESQRPSRLRGRLGRFEERVRDYSRNVRRDLTDRDNVA